MVGKDSERNKILFSHFLASAGGLWLSHHEMLENTMAVTMQLQVRARARRPCVLST
jgi:hypothetical protein